MKAITDFRYSHGGNISEYATRKKRSILKRISPFVLLSLFLILWFLITLVAGANTGIKIKLLLFPFLLINIVFADFATWNYLAGKKKWLMWILEGVVSIGIIYWLL
jgi:hypothetical protein